MQEIWHQSVLFEALLDIFHLWSILESEHLRHWHTHHSVHAKFFLQYIFDELSIEKIFLKCHCVVMRTLKVAINQYLLHEFLIKTWHWKSLKTVSTNFAVNEICSSPCSLAVTALWQPTMKSSCFWFKNQ